MNTLQPKQSGFTLIELMISLTLGLVIMLAAIQLFVTNQMGFNLQRGMGDVQENGRFALDYISYNTRSAEFNLKSDSISGQNISGIIMSTTSSPAGVGFVSCDDCITLGVDKSDQLVVRQAVSLAIDDFRDCEGNSVPKSATGKVMYVLSRYFVRADAASSSNAALACDAGYYEEGAVAMTNFGDSGVVLLSNVDSFQVQYGMAAVGANAGQRFPVRYVNAATYQAIATPPVISAVRLAILVRSSETAGQDLGTPPNVNVLDKTVLGSVLADKKVHRLFTTSLALRNAI